MANSEEVEEVIDLWDEENGEYEVNNPSAPQQIRAKSTFNNITTENGFEFETTEQTEAEKEELNKKELYWTRDEMVAHLSSNPRPDDDICDKSDIYDERIKYMEDICNNGVFKRVLRQGVGEIITENSAVCYNLNGYLEGQDEPFDSSWLRGRPNLHKLSYDTILSGICKGLLTMRRGERSEFIVRPQFAYLEMGCPPRIPENATILFIIEVVKVFEEGSLAHLDSMDVEEREKVDFNVILQLCDTERVSANSYFKAENYRNAAFRYRRAIRCLEQMHYRNSEDETQAKQLLLKLYYNIANTYNKMGKPYNAMSNCKKALIIDPKSSKALYQYGLAKMMDAQYDTAKEYLTKALALKPKSQEIGAALQRLDQRMNGDRIVEENLYRKMGSLFKK